MSTEKQQPSDLCEAYTNLALRDISLLTISCTLGIVLSMDQFVALASTFSASFVANALSAVHSRKR